MKEYYVVLNVRCNLL